MSLLFMRTVDNSLRKARELKSYPYLVKHSSISSSWESYVARRDVADYPWKHFRYIVFKTSFFELLRGQVNCSFR